MAELAKPAGTILVERSGTLIAEHEPPAAPTSMDYPNERAALAIFRKRITELVVAGWQLSRGDTDIGGPIAVDPRIEAELRDLADPDQIAVYNDWLIEHGDPCGELAVMRAKAVPHDELVVARGYELFGCFHDLVAAIPAQRRAIEPQWRHGWIEGWIVERLSRSTLFAFALHAPMARFASRLVVRGGCHAPTLRYALARSSHKRAIRTLEITERGMAAHLLGSLPAVETLAMLGGETCDGHATVRSLSLEIAAGTTQSLFSGRWPALERLTIRAPKISGRIVAKLLEEAPLEKLRALKHVDVDADLDGAALDRIRERLRDFTT